MNARSQSGFTLLELMIVTVIMSIISVGLAEFSVQVFRKQTSTARQSQELTSERGNLNLLERDITLAGYGQPLGVRSAYSAPSTHARSDELVLVGGPLVGPRTAAWTYVLSASSGNTLTVRCFGRDQSGTIVPDEEQDIHVGSSPQPVQILNFAGQSLFSGARSVVASSNSCSQPGTDLDGDGTADQAMTLTLNDIVSVGTGTIIVPTQGYTGVTDATVRYFVYNDQLWRKASALNAVPVLDNVEAFQVQYGTAATSGTQLTWESAPPWNPDRRLRAIRYAIVTATNRGLGYKTNQVTALDATYTAPAGREVWERRRIEQVVRTPNTNFAHP